MSKKWLQTEDCKVIQPIKKYPSEYLTLGAFGASIQIEMTFFSSFHKNIKKK